MSLSKAGALAGALAGAALTLAPGNALAGWELNMPEGVTPISRDVFDLHMIILWICVAIGVVVFGVMFWSILRHRKSRGVEAAQFHHSTAAEIVWSVIPFFILVAMAIPATRTLIAMEDTSSADMTVKITGYQWKWHYDYLDQGISFYSNLAPSSRAAIYGDPTQVQHYLREVDNRLVLPVGEKIHLLITSGDVIHAWWVPDLGQKKDAIPGYINEMWTRIDEPGVYRGQCAELCGKDHAFMPIVVEAKTQADYRKWVAEQTGGSGQASGAQQVAAAGGAGGGEEDTARQWSKDDLMAKGKEVYTTHCVACHQAGGEGMPPTFPALKGSPIATGPLPGHLDRVLHGKQGTAMQAFGPQLSNTELAAVITYERNAFGNDTGDVVQPADVQAAR